jgi:hypothetical protein
MPEILNVRDAISLSDLGLKYIAALREGPKQLAFVSGKAIKEIETITAQIADGQSTGDDFLDALVHSIGTKDPVRGYQEPPVIATL